ncbi:MAG: hypothetical protein AB7O28_18565 [Vicinamibacterales bacterium]
MDRRIKFLLLALVVPPLFLLFIALGGWVVMLLWNWLLPPLFGVSAVTFWQALGLLALCRILFGGFSARGSGGSHVRHRMRQRMADRMSEKWDSMTPEERERARRGLRGRWVYCAPGEEPPAGGVTAEDPSRP